MMISRSENLEVFDINEPAVYGTFSRSTGLTRSLPLFDPKPKHTTKLSRVVRNQYQVVGACNRGYQQVVGTDRLSPRRKIAAY